MNLIQAPYSNTTGGFRAHGELSLELVTSSGLCQDCTLSSSSLNFVIDMLLEITLSSSDISGIDLPGDSLVELEYTDNLVLFGKDADKIVFDHLKQ
ncbi:unnamed protein product [Schistosoma margrebowiei]|uniref:Uncharacterized protein n=1 Tax=Schistosoma margrebowiei TaxID=48269 RepID=A0A183NA61_9TREM|nr:unnamed protein product [Schistosoma margrebowiei]